MIARYCFLRCDACGEEFDQFAPYAGTVRDAAVDEGWKVNKHGGDKDVCPPCLDVWNMRTGSRSQAAQSGSQPKEADRG